MRDGIPECVPLHMSLQIRKQDELRQVREELDRAALAYAAKYGGSIIGQSEIKLGHMLTRTFYWRRPA